MKLSRLSLSAALALVLGILTSCDQPPQERWSDLQPPNGPVNPPDLSPSKTGSKDDAGSSEGTNHPGSGG